MVVDINHALEVVKKNNKNYIICESGIKSFEQYQNLISKGYFDLGLILINSF